MRPSFAIGVWLEQRACPKMKTPSRGSLSSRCRYSQATGGIPQCPSTFVLARIAVQAPPRGVVVVLLSLARTGSMGHFALFATSRAVATTAQMSMRATNVTAAQWLYRWRSLLHCLLRFCSDHLSAWSCGSHDALALRFIGGCSSLGL